MYTAKIISKSITDGLLTVVIEYSDGKTSFQDKMVSRSGQADDWVEQEVKRRIAELEGLSALQSKISTGAVSVATEKPVGVKTAKDTYAEKLREFEAWLNALRQGVTTVDRPAFVALKQWLHDNWQDEYLELYLR